MVRTYAHGRGLGVVIAAILIGFLEICPNTLQAQNAPAETLTPGPRNTPDSQGNLGKLLDAYATIAGGWYLEQRCNHFGKDYKAEFEWNVAQINMALARRVSQNFLLKLQQSARAVADRMTCGNGTQSLVVQTLIKSRETAKLLTGQIYSPATAKIYDAQRLAVLLTIQTLDDKCKQMPREFRTEFDSRLAAITDDFARSVGSSTLDKMKEKAVEAAEHNAPSCDPKTEGFLKQGLLLARQMSPSWKSK